MALAQPASGYPLVRNGVALSALVLGAGADSFRNWLAAELRQGLRRLTGVDIPVTTEAALPDVGVLLAVGGPATNALAARAAAACGCDFSQLPAEGYWLRTVTVDGRVVVLCGGNDDRGDMYGAYALLETLGLVFELTGDVVPETRPDLALPELAQRAVPVQPHRGLMYYDLLMPWAGLTEFSALLDQMAKLRLNRFMFFFYTGAPWVAFSYQGEPALIGDLYAPESGYRTLRMNTQAYEAADMPIGAEAFGRQRVGSAEFQGCQTPQAAHAAARQVLQQVITHAHARRIEVWLAAGDCPGTHPNLARHAREVSCWTTQCGLVVAPGDPVGLGAWEALMTALIDTYPEADRYVVGLAEWAMDASQPGTRAIIDRYAHLRALIPSVAQLRELGYDYADPPYNYRDEALRDSELVLLHYGRELTERLRHSRPGAALGLYVLGRAFMFRALDAAVAPGVVFASMEASICWNRRTRRLPVELFGGLGPREAIVVPRLDDGESGFGMQFNASLFANDRIIGDPAAAAPSGTIAALGGRLHGVEANARCLADAGWDSQLRPAAFYARYAARLGFALAPDSQAQVRQTVAAWPWAWRSGDPPSAAPPALGTRLRMECELLLEREAWPQALAALQGWGGLALLDGALQADRHWRRRLHWATRLGVPRLPALLAGAPDPLALAERLQLPHRQHRLLARFLELRRRLAGSTPPLGSVAPWCTWLEGPGSSADAVALALASGLGPRRPLLRWWLRWRHLGSGRSAAALMAEEGLVAGPALGERLRQLRAERLARERA